MRPKRAPKAAARPAMPKSFHRWFDGSEVVNEDGSPRVVYHGTRAPVDFDVFRFGTQNAPDGSVLIGGGGDASAFLGPHFAESRAIADAFACGGAADWDRNRRVAEGECGGRVIPVYLAIRNPNVFEDDEAMIRGFDGIYETGRSPLVEDVLRDQYKIRRDGELEDEEGELVGRADAVSDALYQMEQSGIELDGGEPMALVARQQLAADAVRRWKREGFDGVHYWNSIESESLGLDWDSTWIPFSPQQIKSAVGNDGGYRKRVLSIVRNPPAAASSRSTTPAAERPFALYSQSPHPSQPWVLLSRYAEKDVALDEARSPTARPEPGTCFRVMRRGRLAWLGVADDDGVVVESTLEKPTLIPTENWYEAWEGPDADGVWMLEQCWGIERSRLVMAACAVARRALAGVPVATPMSSPAGWWSLRRGDAPPRAANDRSIRDRVFTNDAEMVAMLALIPAAIETAQAWAEQRVGRKGVEDFYNQVNAYDFYQGVYRSWSASGPTSGPAPSPAGSTWSAAEAASAVLSVCLGSFSASESAAAAARNAADAITRNFAPTALTSPVYLARLSLAATVREWIPLGLVLLGAIGR